jgi:hypothetical protein
MTEKRRREGERGRGRGVEGHFVMMYDRDAIKREERGRWRGVGRS